MTEEEKFEAGAATCTVSLPSGGFEGPLDLLLHLCQKHELDILDIPIAFVTARYLEYIMIMQVAQLDVAAEYLVMAATLAHIKSKMLLPAPPPGQEDEISEDEEDPRAALISRLLEYQKYKRAGEDLTARGVTGRDSFVRGATIEEAVQAGVAPLADVPLYRLVEAFQAVVARSKVKLTHDIVADRISITDRIHQLTDVLRTLRRTSFEELFEGVATPFDLVITFLALLEMSRLRMTRLFQVDPLSTLYVELADSFGSDIGGEFEDGPRPEDARSPDGAESPTEDPQFEEPASVLDGPPNDDGRGDAADSLPAGLSDDVTSDSDGAEEQTEISSFREFDVAEHLDAHEHDGGQEPQADRMDTEAPAASEEAHEATRDMATPDEGTLEDNAAVDDGA